MKKLPLVFRSDWHEKQSEIEGLCRHFHSIILEEVTVTDDSLSKVLENLAGEARYFEMDQVRISKKQLPNILNRLKSVEKIFIKDLIINDPKEDVEWSAVTTLQALRSLVVVNSSFTVISCLNSSKVQVRDLRVSCKTPEFTFKPLTTFLQNQTGLEIFCLRIFQKDALQLLVPQAGLKKYKFQLKKLAIDYNRWDVDKSSCDAFASFVNQHKETLEDLELQQNLSNEVLEFVMRNMKVKRLIIDVNKFPVRPMFYNSIPPNKFLKTLAIKGLLGNMDIVRGIFHVYQHIQKLAIYNWTDEIANDALICIANTMKSLNYMEIPCLTTDTPEIPIPTLKTLYIDFVGNALEYQRFCVSNPSLTRLIVKWTTLRDIFTYEIMDAITRGLPNLKCATFGAYFNPSTRILEMMSQNCRQPQVLELLQEKEDPPTQRSSRVGMLSIRYFAKSSVKSVFKDIRDSSLWVEDDLNDIDEDSDIEYDDEDDEEGLMDWEDDELTEGEEDEEYEDFAANGRNLLHMMGFFQR
jgi:hypothetical protein